MAENDIWTIKAALDWTVGYLGRKGDENPRLSAQWLLAEACGLRRIDLYTRFDQPLSLDERAVLRDYVTRRGRGEPLQYITGEVAFRHIAVKVRAGVLIPRPETEVLVSEALSLLPPAPRPRAAEGEEAEAPADGVSDPSAEPPAPRHPDRSAEALEFCHPEGSESAPACHPERSEAESRDPVWRQPLEPEIPEALLVADLCTGSGCIACSIAYEHPLARVIATDIAPEAAALARENAQAVGVADRVSVVEGDLGECIDPALAGTFDLVVSNPPYVPTAVLAQIPREVADFEPALALDGGADGLDVFRRLLPWCARALKPGGAFAMELHEDCLDAAAALARAAGFESVRIARDLADRPRILTARKAW